MNATFTRSPRVPAWLVWTAFALSLLGLGISTYLTIEHFSADSTLACPATGIVDCAAVTSSAYATFLGIPVAVLGLGYFIVLTLLMSPPAWGRLSLVVPRVAVCAAGVLMVLWLVYAELFLVDKICLWCTAVHAITLVIFGLVVLFGQGTSRRV